MDREILKQVILKFGMDHQMNICIEEMSELMKEICKYKRGRKNRKEILEELVDVSIMMQQLVIMFHIKNDEYMEMLNYKIQRLKERLDNHD